MPAADGEMLSQAIARRQRVQLSTQPRGARFLPNVRIIERARRSRTSVHNVALFGGLADDARRIEVSWFAEAR